MAQNKLATQAIIDTSVLLSLYHLNLLHFLNLLYNEVRVPSEVEKEFLNFKRDEKGKDKRFSYITNFYDTHHSWFLKCNEYGTDLVNIYLADKKLDKGEAEVFAQNQTLDTSYELLLDEKEGRKVAQTLSVQHHGVLYILATLDLKFKRCTYRDSLEILSKANIGWFSEAIIQQVYNEVSNNN